MWVVGDVVCVLIRTVYMAYAVFRMLYMHGVRCRLRVSCVVRDICDMLWVGYDACDMCYVRCGDRCVACVVCCVCYVECVLRCMHYLV